MRACILPPSVESSASPFAVTGARPRSSAASIQSLSYRAEGCATEVVADDRVKRNGPVIGHHAVVGRAALRSVRGVFGLVDVGLVQSQRRNCASASHCSRSRSMASSFISRSWLMRREIAALRVWWRTCSFPDARR